MVKTVMLSDLEKPVAGYVYPGKVTVTITQPRVAVVVLEIASTPSCAVTLAKTPVEV
jgi:hypothetical protein